MVGLGKVAIVGLAAVISLTSALDYECPKPYLMEENFGLEACLYRSTYPMSWSSARKACLLSNKGDLVTINSMEKIKLILHGSDSVWVGLRKVKGTPYYKWVDDDTPLEMDFNTELFVSDKPERLKDRDTCVMMDKGHRKLRHYPCYVTLLYICEFEPNRTKIVFP